MEMINLDRAKIRKLLIVGLLGSVATGIGDFFLGYGENVPMSGIAGMLMGNAQNLSDGQLIAGGLLGMFGLLLEAFGFFGIFRLMADAAPKQARLYRIGVIMYIWLAPIGCHMNVGVFNMAFKYLLNAGYEDAVTVGNKMILSFCMPVYILLFIFWIPMLAIAFRVFGKEQTPYPGYAKWFNLFTGVVPTAVIGLALTAMGSKTEALGSAIATMCLSAGNAVTFGGLLAVMPTEEKFQEFRERFAGRKQQPDNL